MSGAEIFGLESDNDVMFTVEVQLNSNVVIPWGQI